MYKRNKTQRHLDRMDTKISKDTHNTDPRRDSHAEATRVEARKI